MKNQPATSPNTAPADVIDALAPLFCDAKAVTRDQLAAIAAALDSATAQPVLSACCRAVALRSLISSAIQTNNAEAARRAAMTLLERFAPDQPAPTHAFMDPQAIARTHQFLERLEEHDPEAPE